MDDQKYKKLLVEYEKRLTIKANKPDIFKGAFKQQIDFVMDPAKLKTVFCTRRSAKSYSLGLALVYECLQNPKSNGLFTGLTRASAKGIIWKDILHVINDKFKLGAKFNQTDLTMTFPNGSEIWCTGIDADEKEMRKVLGRKFRIAAKLSHTI